MLPYVVRARAFALLSVACLGCACGGDVSESSRFNLDIDATGKPSASSAAPNDAAVPATAQRLTEEDEHLFDVWGSGKGDVFAVGSKGSILHYDGRRWTRQFTAAAGLASIWGSSASDVYAGGADSELLHYDGARWSSLGIELDGDPQIWGTSADDVYVLDYDETHHFDGRDWSLETREDVPIEDIGGNKGDVIGLSTGTVFRRLGEDWAPISIPKARRPMCPRAAWSKGDDAVVVGELGTTLRRDRKGWHNIANPFDTDFVALWASDATDVFALGRRHSIYHFNGRQWTAMEIPAGSHPDAILGFAANKVFAVGEKMLTYNGASWSATPNPPGVGHLTALWGSSANDVWAVGEAGAIVHYDGSNWAREHPPQNAIGKTAPPTPVSGAVDPTPLCPPRDVTGDPDYVRGKPTGVIVEVLYEDHPVATPTHTTDPPRVTCGPVHVSLGESRLYGVSAIRRNSDGFVEIGDIVLIRPDGAFELRQPTGGWPIHHDSFEKDAFTYCGGVVRQARQPVSLSFDVGEVAVRSVDVLCDDTGINEVRIKDGSNWFELTATLNVELFEYDIDKDQSKELYVISAQTCGGWLRIMRVRRSN